MMQTMTRGTESSAATGYLLVAFELSQRWWKVGFTTGMGHRGRTRRIAAGALESLAQAIADAKQMCGVAADAPVISCYEAGRDGFWLHRYLTGRGATNYVVDSASIEVDRRPAGRRRMPWICAGCWRCSPAMWPAIGTAGGWCGCRVWPTKTRGSSIGRGKPCRAIGRA